MQKQNSIVATRRHFAAVLLIGGLFCVWFSGVEARDQVQPIRLLSMQDPFARVWNEHAGELQTQIGLEVVTRLADYESSKRAIGINAARRFSGYDIIAIDAVWMGDLATQGILLALDDFSQFDRFDASAFLEPAWESGKFQGVQLAIPIQPHPEVLIYRRSILDELGESVPATTDDLLRIAARVSREIPNMEGICWNAASGAALGQQMLHFAGAFGFEMAGEQQSFSVSDSAWRSAFEFAQSLVQSSPPMAQDMAWDGRIDLFRSGRCAMSYAWGGRTASLETSGSPVAGDVGYAAAPHGPEFSPVTPLGVWLLAIPANLHPDRISAAMEAILALTSTDSVRFLMDKGVSALPRQMDGSLDTLPVIKLVDHLWGLGQLSVAMRPPIPKFQTVSEIIGVEAHRVLFGSVSVEEALPIIDERLRTVWSVDE